MKPSLQLRIGHSLTMTPQLQQAIRLLQLSTLELQTEVQEALETNPMLELDEEQPSDPLNGKDSLKTQAAQEANSSEEAPAVTDTSEQLNGSDTIPDELPLDSNWEEIYDTPALSAPAIGDDKSREFLENQTGLTDALIDHLLWQLHNTRMSDIDLAIAISIVDGINDDGYLTESVEDIHEGLVEELEIELDEVKAVLHRVQRFDPPGIAARTLRECLLLQLEQFSNDAPNLDNARLVIDKHLELLGSHDYTRLKRKTQLSEDALSHAINFIQGLNPKPGSHISNSTTQYVIPDIFVTQHNGKWRVELNQDTSPKLKINSLYASFVRRSDRGAENTYLKNNLQEARWFIKSLQSRSETMLRVGNAIVEKQRLFLEYGDEGMKPMVLRDIAVQLDLHESTISRVTTMKYMHTPRGIFEFKFFFSSHVNTADGGECSATAIRAMVRKLIENENTSKPLSDNKIATFLVKEGINVARRTVAKYREAMSIPPSNERKRFS